MKNRFGLSRDIPSDVRKRVRRRCGFGCAICGNAIVTYEHFDPPFREARAHKSEGITLLCGTHQLESSKGLLSKETIARANANPICRERGYASHSLDLGSGRPMLVVGGTDFTQCGAGVAVDGKWLLQVNPPEPHSLRWRLSASFYSEAGELTCRIRDNELLIASAPFEIQQVGGKLTIKDESKVLLDLEVTPPRKISIDAYRIPLANGMIFIGKRSLTSPLTGITEAKGVIEFSHSTGSCQTFVDCTFRSDTGINLVLSGAGLSFSAMPNASR